MWWTEYGKCILEGAEAKVFVEALLDLLDESNLSKQFDDYNLGVDVFDNLTYGQKISVLAIIGNCLLRRDVPTVELTAVLEGAIAAVFKHLVNLITFDIDVPDLGTKWREMVVAARKEAEGEDIPIPNCNDLEEWEIEVETLADFVLPDVDYEDSHLYLDGAPEKSKMLRKLMGISDKYHLAIANDLNDKEVNTKLAELKKLCQSIIKA